MTAHRPPENAEKVRSEPTLVDLVQELRLAVGLFDGAMPCSPRQAWGEALERVRLLKAGACWRCMEKEAGEAAHVGPFATGGNVTAMLGVDKDGNPIKERIIPLSERPERLAEALTWVLAHDYGDSIVPPRRIADTMAAVAHSLDGSREGE